ncbi:MAG: hypothetical protein PHS14_00080 [Elusimicrobia bacterium]|nr:hypothetical protein [Elusimicrobiota bacterium]
MTPPYFSKYGRGPRVSRLGYRPEPRLRRGDVVLAPRPGRVLLGILTGVSSFVLTLAHPVVGALVGLGAWLYGLRRRAAADRAFYVERL